VIDGSYSELLAEQAVDDAAGDDETEDDERRCQAWSGLIMAASPVLPAHGAQ